MTELPRKAFARGARLAGLPLGYAGRQAVGLGRRLGGAPADAVLSEVQQRTAEQIFRTLGELKGGAMKFGQALSILEVAMPEELVAPYREQLTALQDSAPPMPTQTIRDEIAADLGRDWRQRLVELDPMPAAAASIGQVHRGVWRDEDGGTHDVAVKVQYPGADKALLSDLRQIGRLGRSIGTLLPGIDVKPLVDELLVRAEEELDYRLEAEAQHAFATEYAGDPDISIPDVVAQGTKVLVTEWMDSRGSLARLISEGSQEERDHYAEMFVRFLLGGPARTGMLHADPHPGNFRMIEDGRLGVLDFGAVARLPEGGLPPAMGRLLRIAEIQDAEHLLAGLRDEGFVRPGIRIRAEDVQAYLAPFVEPSMVERFRFSRSWMRAQAQRLQDPKDPAFTVGLKLNLPPSYLLIHRTWLGGLGVLSQLEAEAPFRAIMEEYLPGYA